jgi:very-short-patch-repair endonuclease
MSDEPHPQYTAPPPQWEKLKPLAREMRHAPTAAENALWQQLRSRQIGGAKFRRQHAIEGFIVDFPCIPQRLVIEVDGDVHERLDQQQYDRERQQIIEAKGFRVLRFSNDEIQHSLDDVIECIRHALRD